MMRLRIGKRNGSGAVPGGHSDSRSPRRADARPQVGVARAGTARRARCRRPPTGRPAARRARRGGRPRRCPWPGRTRRPPRPRRAPRPSPAAVSRPAPVALRVPTMPTRRASSTARSPRTNSTAGGSGRGAAASGYAGVACSVTATMPLRGTAAAHVAGTRRRRRRPPRRSTIGGRSIAATAGWAARRAGGDGERLGGLVVGEQGAQAGQVIRSNPASAARRPVGIGCRPSRHQPRRRRAEPGAQRQRDSHVLDVDRALDRRTARRRRAGRRSCERPGGCGGSRAR